jgi:predicted permease
VIGQVALSLVLVVAAGLLVGSFRRLATVDPGFRSEGVLVVSTNWSETGLSEDRQRGLPREMLERLRMIPAVRGAAASLVTPISGSAWNDYIIVDGFAPQNANDALAWFNAVTDGFLETLDTRLLAGRGLTPQDKEGAARVILVNETLARRFFGDGSPLGRHIRTNVHDSVGPPMEVVGVVADGKYRRVDEETLPTAYVPLEQTALWFPGIELSLRLDAAAAAVMPVVTQALAELHPDISLEYTTLSEQVASSLARPRLLAALSGFFGFLALLLAVIGLYGTMSYAVARRRNEMGIRIALGSARSGILGLVAREAGKVVTVGVVLGIVLAPAGTRLIAAFLFGVTAWDPVTLAVSALVLTAVAMAAAMVPAWRAATVDPMVALREE